MDIAYLVPLAAALVYAIYQLMTRMMSADEHAVTTFFYTPVAGAVVGSAILPFVWVAPATFEIWGLMVVCGILGGAGHFLLIKAFERSEASLIAPFTYSSILWATLFGWVVFDRLPDLWTYGGAALIIASGLYIWHRERVLALRTKVALPPP
jgi:drug/metabolite transporter (DMT)-like permease